MWGLTAELEVVGLKRQEGFLRSMNLNTADKRADSVGSLEDYSSPTILTPPASASSIPSSSTLAPAAALYKATVGVPFRVVTSSDELPLRYRLLNMMYDHPFRLLCACGLPIVAFVYNSQKDYHHLKFSQKVMQTRVLGQFTAVSLLLGLMGWNAYMDEHGRYVTEKQALIMGEEVKNATQLMLKHIDDENKRTERMRESSRRARIEKLGLSGSKE